MDYQPLKSNTRSISKDVSIIFNLNIKRHLLQLKPEKIVWKVFNRGREVEEIGEEKSFEMTDYENKYRCLQRSKYNGHHYMMCTLYNAQGRIIGRDKFGIFICDESQKLIELGVLPEIETEQRH